LNEDFIKSEMINSSGDYSNQKTKKLIQRLCKIRRKHFREPSPVQQNDAEAMQYLERKKGSAFDPATQVSP
jgi:hypothetical protein